MLRMILTVVLAIFLAGCGATKIRIVNRSNVPFRDVVVKFPSSTENYGTIPPGGASDYRTVKGAYHYAYIECTIEGQPAVLQPHDYVGETPLGSGNYSYALTYTGMTATQHDRLRLELVKE